MNGFFSANPCLQSSVRRVLRPGFAWLMVLAVLFLASPQAMSQSRIDTAKHENGQVKHEIPYSKGERHGHAKWYNNNGKLSEEGTYKEGVAQGA